MLCIDFILNSTHGFLDLAYVSDWFHYECYKDFYMAVRFVLPVWATIWSLSAVSILSCQFLASNQYRMISVCYTCLCINKDRQHFLKVPINTLYRVGVDKVQDGWMVGVPLCSAVVWGSILDLGTYFCGTSSICRFNWQIVSSWKCSRPYLWVHTTYKDVLIHKCFVEAKSWNPRNSSFFDIYRPLSEPLKPLKAFILDEEPLEPLKCLFGPF